MRFCSVLERLDSGGPALDSNEIGFWRRGRQSYLSSFGSVACFSSDPRPDLRCLLGSFLMRFYWIRVLVQVFRGLRYRLTMLRYDDFTIAEHFRKQGAKVGSDTRLLVRSLGTEPYLISIGDRVTISGGVSLLTHDGGSWLFTKEVPSLQRFGKIDIRDNCYIGAAAIILPNVTIGPNSVVGAGSVVTRDVPPDTVVAGNPARVIRPSASYRQKIEEIWSIQKPPGYFGDVPTDGTYSPAEISKMKARYAPLLRKHLIRLLLGEDTSHLSGP